MPKVSIIVVIYDGRQFIKPVFDAIFGQTHADLEVIRKAVHYELPPAHRKPE